LAICCAQNAVRSSKVARVAGAGPGPRHRLDADAAVAAGYPAQLVLEKAAPAGEIEMPPAPHGPVVHPAVDLATGRARQPATAQRDADDHPLGGQPDVGDPGARQRQQAVQCGGDAHAVAPLKAADLDNRQPSPGGGGASLRSAQPARRTSARSERRRAQALLGDAIARAPTQTRGDPYFELDGWWWSIQA
jgi:hypothetical protein